MEMNQRSFNLIYDQLRTVIQENNDLKNKIEQLTNNIVTAIQAQEKLHQQNQALENELTRTQNIVESLNEITGGEQHVQRINLLKSKEPTSFTNKTNYSVWAEGIKADLVPVLPELKQFFKFAETIEFLDKDMVKYFIENDTLDPELKHGLTPKDAWDVDSKIFGLLHDLTRSHEIACLKTKN